MRDIATLVDDTIMLENNKDLLSAAIYSNTKRMDGKGFADRMKKEKNMPKLDPDFVEFFDKNPAIAKDMGQQLMERQIGRDKLDMGLKNIINSQIGYERDAGASKHIRDKHLRNIAIEGEKRSRRGLLGGLMDWLE